MSQQSCYEEFLNSGEADNIILYVQSGLAVVIAIFYGFLQKRHRELCGYSRPSIVIPLDLIHSTPERWVYVLLFASLSGILLLSIQTNGFGFVISANDTILGAIMGTIALMLFISILYYPAFASIRAPIPLVGYCLGLVYFAILSVDYMWRYAIVVASCLNTTNNLSTPAGTVSILTILPTAISHVCVILWFIWKIPYEIFRVIKSKKPKMEALFELPMEHKSRNRVKWLLSKWKLDPGVKGDEEVEEYAKEKEGKYAQKVYYVFYKAWKYIYKYDPNIYYPLRFLAAIVMMVYIVYFLTMTITTLSFIYVVPVVDLVENASMDVQDLIEVLEQTDRNLASNISGIIQTAYDILKDSVYGMAVVVPAGPLLSFVVCMVLLLHMIGAVHIHLKKIAIGDYGFLPEKLASPSYRLVNSMQYVGFQVGYFTWAWILLTLFVWLVGLVGLIMYFLLKFFLNTVGRILINLALPIIYSFVLYYIQLIMVKFFFVGDTNNKHVVISNLRLFHLLSYILVFQNTVVGVTSAFIRILYAILFGLLLLFRLDRVVLMKGFERFDKGHKSYIGFLYLEHTLNNAVLNVFVNLLLEGDRKRKEAEKRAFRDKSMPLALTQMEDWIDKSAEEVVTYPRVSQRALNRWMVAYTLTLNKDLVQYTATHLAHKRELQEKRQKKHHLSPKDSGEEEEEEGEGEEELGAREEVVHELEHFHEELVGGAQEEETEGIITVTTFVKADVEESDSS